LPEFQTNHAQSNHRNRIGHIFELEEFVRGDNPVAETLPCIGNYRSGPGGNDDFFRSDTLTVFHLQQIGLDEVGIAFDEHALGHPVCAVGDHALDEHIAQVLHVFHRLAEIQAEAFVAFQAKALENPAAVKILGDLDHCL